VNIVERSLPFVSSHKNPSLSFLTPSDIGLFKFMIMFIPISTIWVKPINGGHSQNVGLELTTSL
jgi:hypothetical protein